MEKSGQWFLKIVYFALAIPMFYFFDIDITIGGFGFQYQYLFGMGIIALALTVFLISPDLKRAILSVRYAAVSALPYLWTLAYSFALWVVIMPEFRVITRGFFYVGYQLIAILAAAATVYMFGNKGIYMQLTALLTANSMYVFQAISENSVGEFFTQYIEVIVSFTSNTGAIMKQFEGLGYSFAMGFVVVYFFLNTKDWKKNILWALVSCAFLFLGLKRTVLAAVILAVVLGLFIQKVLWSVSKSLLSKLSWVLIVVGLIYIVACSMGLFDFLEAMGVDTMGRAWVFRAVNSLYEIGPGFMGRGAGFISGSIATGELVLNMDGYLFGEIHNDLLRQYIELGMIGFLVWGFLFLRYRIGYFFHKSKEKPDMIHGIIASAIILTVFVTFMTDNNLYYYYTTIFMTIVIMGYRYEEYAQKIKLPGEE